MRRSILLAFFLLISMAMQPQEVREEKDGFKWIPYLEYGRIGAQSENGQIIIPAKYETCYYEKGHFLVTNSTGNTAVFSKEGKVFVPIESTYQIFEVADMEKNSPFIVVGDGEYGAGYGVYSPNGKEIIPKKYKAITPFVTSKGIYYVAVAQNGLSGLIDSNGNVIIEPNKYNVLFVSEINGEVYVSYLIYGDERSSGICDLSGNVIFDTKYSYVIPALDQSGDMYYKIAIGDSEGRMSKDGIVIHAPAVKKSFKYTKFGNGFLYIVIDENSRFGIANKNKQIVVPCEYDFIEAKYPYIELKRGRYMGMLDQNLRSIISTNEKFIGVAYVDVKEPFIAAKKENGKNALFDLNGKQLSAPLYHEVFYHVFSNVNDTILYYQQNRLWGVKTISGKSVFPPIYEDLNFMETPIGNFYYVFKDKLVGLCNSEGVEIIEPQFTGIVFKRQKGKDYFYAENGGYAAVFNTDGTQLINGETFSSIIYNENESQFIAMQGKRKCHFTKDGVLLRDNSLDIEQDKYISLADSYFEEGKFGQAAKNYGLAIDIEPRPSLYFNRGVSYYNAAKYDEAILDFKLCLENNPSKNLRIRSLELIDKAEEYQIQKERRRTNIANAIFGLVLTGANMYFEIQQQKQHNKYSASRSNGNSHSSSNSSENNSGNDDTLSPTSTNKPCPSLKANRGKWYCANTGECGMCGGTGLMDNPMGLPDDKCTLCGGTGKCKYCQ